MKTIRIFGAVIKELFSISKTKAALTFLLLAASSLNGYVLLKFIDYITWTAEQVQDGAAVDSLSVMAGAFPYLLLLFVLQLISQYYSIHIIRFNTQVDEYLNARIKRKLGNVRYEYYESSSVYAKLNRVNERVVKGYNAAINSIVKITEILFYMLFYLIYLTKINMAFSAAIVCSVVCCGVAAARMSKSRNKMFADITRLNQKRDYLEGIPKGRISHQEYQSGRLFQPIFQRYRGAYMDAQNGYLRIHKHTVLAELRALLMFALTLFFSYLYLSAQVAKGITAVGAVISLMIIFDNLYKKSEALSYYISNRMEDILIINEYCEIMDYRETQVWPKESGESYIRFDNVSYRYPQSEKKTLDQLCLEIRRGEKIAVVGENGSGKTTFSNILLGLLAEFDGRVTIGNQVYTRQNPPLAGLAQSLGQDFTMYQTTIRENVLFREEKDTAPQPLSDLFRVVGIDGFIDSLAEKSGTSLGQLEEGGIELSKGQEQKIAAARFLANSKTAIWIFDEPTAYLDPLAEIDMYDFLYKLSAEKTMLFISHRLGFAPRADRIIVLRKGRVAETGTHEELMKSGGIYAGMYEAQRSQV